MATLLELQKKMRQLWPHLNERSKRMLAAAEAVEIGYGGVSLVSRACGLSRVTLTKGIKELTAPPLPGDRIRRLGGGRWRLTVRDPALPNVLEALVEPLTRGDPESPLRWTCKSTRTLARELQGCQYPIRHEEKRTGGQLCQSRSSMASETNRRTGSRPRFSRPDGATRLSLRHL